MCTSVKKMMLFLLAIIELVYAQTPAQPVSVSVKEIEVGENLRCKRKIKAHAYQVDSTRNKEGRAFTVGIKVSTKNCEQLVKCQKGILGLRENGTHIAFFYDEAKKLFWAIDTSEELAQAVADAKAEGYLHFLGDAFFEENIQANKGSEQYFFYINDKELIAVTAENANTTSYGEMYRLYHYKKGYSILVAPTQTIVLDNDNQEVAVIKLDGFSANIGDAYYFTSKTETVKVDLAEIVGE